MRRSAIRSAMSTIVAAVAPGDAGYGLAGAALVHIPGLDLVQPGAAPRHLTFAVTLGQTVVSDRSNVGSYARTPCRVDIGVTLRSGMVGRWADLDLASDLAEDVAAAVLNDGNADWNEVWLDGLDVAVLRDRDDGAAVRLDFTIQHELGED